MPRVYSINTKRDSGRYAPGTMFNSKKIPFLIYARGYILLIVNLVARRVDLTMINLQGCLGFRSRSTVPPRSRLDDVEIPQGSAIFPSSVYPGLWEKKKNNEKDKKTEVLR